MKKKLIILVLSIFLLLVVVVLIQWRSEPDTNKVHFKPLTPKDAVHLPPLKRLIVNAMLYAVRLTGRWDYPRMTDGDFPNMTFVDKLYWLYKSEYPVCRGEKGKNLEAFFAENRRRKVSLPSSFIPEQTLTLSAVGDLMQHDTLASQDYSPYRTIAETLFTTDISFANLESPLTGQDLKNLTIREDESPSLCISRSQFERLKGDGARQFTVMATACNHSLDFEEEGVLTTRSSLASVGIRAIGTNESQEGQARGGIVERKGVRIGFIAATFGLNGKPLPKNKEYLVNRIALNQVSETIDLSLLETQIAWCRRTGCDFIVASLHWGLEYEFFPTSQQITLAHRIIELGVDLILGHHPHVIQPVEYYTPKRDPNRIVPVYYSLGNLSNPFETPFMALSLLSLIELSKGTLDGQGVTYVRKVTNIPMIQELHRGESSGIEFRPLSESVETTTEPDRRKFFHQARTYADLVLGKEWRLQSRRE
jgi:poly-gamma-glutamate synthesis protein (capsule biosynthesis protein)